MTAKERAAEIICENACDIEGGCDRAAQELDDAGLLVTDELLADVFRAGFYAGRGEPGEPGTVEEYLASREGR